jgi:hypothetical protein
VAVDRLRARRDIAYNLFSVSRADVERIRALHKAYFRELKAIVAESKNSRCVALATTQVFAF